ncbi:ankyrin repeat domain-containing protein [bacterium]|jgi:ankyrin repeat protein|nr:ankyrin repeat domain-containing protein [bacterium]
MKYLKTYESKESEINMDWFIAASKGDLETIKNLIKSGINVNCKTTIGKTALHYAICEGNIDIVKELIDNGADVNLMYGDRSNILFTPVKNINNIRKLLIDSDIDLCSIDRHGYTPVYYFIVNAKYKEALFLIQNCKNKDCLEIKSKNGDSPLTLSVYHEQSKLVNALIKRKVNINIRNSHGLTSLMSASSMGYYNITKSLIDAGADLNIQSHIGQTAIIIAAEEENTRIVELLLKYGADLSIIDNIKMCVFQFSTDFWNDEQTQEYIMSTQPNVGSLMKKYIKIHPNIEEKYSVYFDMGDIGLF